MHLPDAWGYIIFGSTKLTATIDSDKNYEVDAEQDDSEVLPIKRDRTWPARCAAMNICAFATIDLKSTGMLCFLRSCSHYTLFTHSISSNRLCSEVFFDAK